MLSDEEELKKIKRLERAFPKEELFVHHGILKWDDDNKLKFHKYVKGIAQRLLGDSVNLDDENLVFLLSKERGVNAASSSSKSGERFIYFNKGFLDICENEAQFAFVLAHELQHWIERKDLPVDATPATKLEEAKCDILAIDKVRTAGYDVEEGFKITKKLFDHGGANIFQVLDEHPLSEHRIKYIGVKAMEVRESLIKSGKYKKIPPVKLYNPDISQWEYSALERFFIQDDYVNADALKKMKLWFEQFDKLSQGPDGLQKISREDFKTLHNEYYSWARELWQNKDLDQAYVEVYCKRVLQPRTLLEFDIFKHNFWHFTRPDFRYLGTEQQKLMTDYFKGFRESSGQETKLYCEKLDLLGHAFWGDYHRLFDLSDDAKKNIGIRFSQDVIDAIERDQSISHIEAGVIRDENSSLMVYIDDNVYQLDKDNTIQKYLGSREELERIKKAQEFNSYFELYDKLQSGELPLDQENIRKLLATRRYINELKKEAFYNLEAYLSPEAVKYLKGNFKKKSLWDEKTSDILCQYMKKEDKKLEELAKYEEFMRHIFYSEWEFAEKKKLVDVYFETGGRFFPGAACDVTAVLLAQHLKEGKDLDDFEFLYDKQFYEFNERFLHDPKLREYNDPFLGQHLSDYACFELLKKNPKIDLSQVCEMEYSGGQCDSYFSAYFPHELKEKDSISGDWLVDSVIYNRLYANITNLDNWGDGSSLISDLPYYQRVGKALSDVKMLDEDRSHQIEINTLRNHYKRASIDDKVEYLVEFLENQTMSSLYKNMFNDDNWALYQEDLLNKDIPLEKRLQFAGKIKTTPQDSRIALIKDTMWSEVQEKLTSSELSVTQKIELFNQIAKIEVLDSDKSKYFETLLGKDGQGGLLEEINKSPLKSFEMYKKLLVKDNRIPDPKIRSKVIKLAVQQFIKENGNYNDITASEKEREDFILQTKKLKKQLKSEFSIVDEHEILRCLADLSVSQQKLSGVIKPDPAEIDIKNENIIKAAYGLDGLTYLFNKGIIDRNVFIEYMLSEGKEEDRKKIMDIVAKAKESSEYRYASQNGGDQINESLFINAKKEFDQASLPVQACIMTYLAQGCNWEKQFEVVADKLFYQTGELGEASKKFLRSYISSRPESERYFYLSAMYSASQNKSNFTDNNTDSKYTKEQRSVAEGLRLFLENSGPAGVKLAQAMSSYNGVPDFIRDEMQKAKSHANPPARWEVFDWLEQTQQTEVLQYGKIGELLGSASFFVTYDMIGKDGEERVIKINRLGSSNKAEVEFGIYKDTLNKLKDDFPQISAFKRLIDNASDMVNVETDLGIGEQQLKDAKKLYPDTAKADGVEFKLKVMDWCARGKTWAEMEKASGSDFGELKEPYKKAAAKVIFTTELSNMLSGKRFDSDRHAGQYKIDVSTNTIGIFDTGSMSVTEPTDKEKKVLGLVLAQAVKALAGDNVGNVGSVLCSEIDKGIEKYYKEEIREGKPIPPYLSEFQRGLLALTDFHKDLSSGELSVCLMQALNNGKHQLDPAIYEGFVSGMKEKSNAQMSEVAKKLIGDTFIGAVLSPQQDEAMLKEAELGQRYGKFVFDKLINEEGKYEVLTNLPQDMKSQEFSGVLDSSVGRLHFAKGLMKGCFSYVDPRLYSSEDKQQLGAILHQVIEKGMRLAKLKEPVVLSQIFTETAGQFEPLGEYAKNVSAILKIASKSVDIESFSKAVMLGRFVDEDVQKGYVEALRKSSDASFIKKAMSHISPTALIPKKTARNMVKFVMKKMGPACVNMVVKSAFKGQGMHNEKSAER